MAAITHLLNRVLTVSRPTRSNDAYGGGTDVWAEVATVTARVSRAAPAERQVADQEGVRITHDVYLDVDADVQRGDRLAGDGQTFTVVSVTFPSRRDYLKADAREDLP